MSNEMKYPKRLIEVDLPIKKISDHARQEKTIRHGHISSLHLWWARRPLGACRAVLCASLWPDPADPLCPKEFNEKASELMKQFWDPMNIENNNFDDPLILRKALLNFIADFAKWDNSKKKKYLVTSRRLTQLAHEALGGKQGTYPLIVDPFAGGGAIPLEGLRIGCDVFSSDLNPIPYLLNKLLIEYIPKYGEKLPNEVHKWGIIIKKRAEKKLEKYYPHDSDDTVPISYIWARTILSEAPGDLKYPIEIPLLGSFWLSKKQKSLIALRYKRDQSGNILTNINKVKWTNGKIYNILRPQLEIFVPTTPSEVEIGPLRRGKVTCPITGYTISGERVRKQFKNRKGGGRDSRLIAVVNKKNREGRIYRTPTKEDIRIIEMAEAALDKKVNNHKNKHSLIPDEEFPYLRSIFNVSLLDVKTWGDLFTSRQLLSLTTFVDEIRNIRQELLNEYDIEFANTIQICLALIFDKQADLCTSFSKWDPTAQCPRLMYVRHAIGILWDFAEGCPISDSSGSWEIILNGFVRTLKSLGNDWRIGTVNCIDATKQPLPDNSVNVFFTDPPYYDAIPYADLSDFFYVWLKRTIGDTYPEHFNKELSNKNLEIVQLAERNPKYFYKTHENFKNKMVLALSEGKRILINNGIGVIVFAQKSTTGWEAMLQALIDANWRITASWPIDTELSYRVRAQGAAALGSSIHLVCRSREKNIIGDWRKILEELPIKIHEWMPRLSDEGIVGADAIFSCLGPALEIYSRYSIVEKASGEIVTLKEYLEHIWAAVSKEALNMIFEGADVTGFEEDDRLTAMWLWTLSTGENGFEDKNELKESTKVEKSIRYILEYDAARKIAQGLGAHLEELPNLVEIKGNKARLLPVYDRTKYLFGKEQIKVRKKTSKKDKQITLWGEITDKEKDVEELSIDGYSEPGKTVLDQVHQSMLLFAEGRSEALKRLIIEDGVGNDSQFWKLAQALSALYPIGTDEKRWVEGLMGRKKSLGF